MTMCFKSKHLCFLHGLPRHILITSFIFSIIWITQTHGTHYNNVTNIFTDRLGSSSGYNTAVRPLVNQSQSILVSVMFDIIAIVEIDDISQKFIVNGFLTLSWNDELVVWNPSDYGDIYVIQPYPKDIWRPRLILGNTLQNRDLFEDDYCPTSMAYNGDTFWFPGSLFPTSCKLNLYKYPFDQQMCAIDLYSMGLPPSVLNFTSPTREVGKAFFVESGEWEMVDTSIECGVNYNLSFFQVKFYIKRRPGFFVMNIVMPVVLLSFLNIMVFLIPVESGEKVSYSITVLLALAVFMSIVSEMLPRSSDIMPLVTIYLMVLLIISVFTVIVAILIVSFHHKDEKETRRLKASSTFKGMFNKVKILNRATAPLKNNTMPAPDVTTVEVEENSQNPQTAPRTNAMIDAMKNFRSLKKTVPVPEPEIDKGEKHRVNKWRLIGRYIDIISLVVFMTIWVSVTIGFLIAISS